MGNDDLFRAFARTTFTVEGPWNVAVSARVGEHSRRLDDVVRWYGRDRWTHLTAYNPGGRKTDPVWNRRAHARLLLLLRGYRWLPGAGIPDDPQWEPEPGVLIIGAPLREVGALARQLEQAAIVHGLVGGRARLVRLWR